MRSIVIIPARYASTRFPGKPLALIKGRPMIEWVVQGVRSALGVSQVVVATDDDRIARVLAQKGIDYSMTSSELPSGTDRIYATLQDYPDYDLVINVQGDEPLIQAEQITQLIEVMQANPQAEMGTLITELIPEQLSDLNIVKAIIDQKKQAIYFSRLPIPFTRNANWQPGLVYRHIGIYAYRPGFLAQFCQQGEVALEQAEGLEQLRALAMGAKIMTQIVPFEGVSVDSPEDIIKVEQKMEFLNEKKEKHVSN